MREGFYFENAEAALEFFEACEAAGARTLAERTGIMRQMVKDKKALYIRDADAYIEGKDILKIDKKEPPID